MKILQLGPELQRIAITLPASAGWQDTGLQPDVLATRPLLCGFSCKMLWLCDSKAAPVPVLALRHVADAAQATSDPIPRYVPGDNQSEITPSRAEVRCAAGATLRFPAQPGRIEVRVSGVESTGKVRGFTGYIQLIFYAHVSGPGDAPLRAPIDHITVMAGAFGIDDFPELPPLPEHCEPLMFDTGQGASGELGADLRTNVMQGLFSRIWQRLKGMSASTGHGKVRR